MAVKFSVPKLLQNCHFNIALSIFIKFVQLAFLKQRSQSVFLREIHKEPFFNSRKATEPKEK